MNRLLLLYKGEVVRMKKYGITLASLGVIILWVLILQFIEVGDIAAFFPLVLFVDTTLMSFLLVGVSMMYEKQESAIKSMLVVPITKDDYLLSKSLGAVTSSIITLAVLLIYGMTFKDLNINVLGIIGAVLLVSFVFAQIGIIVTYQSKDFTTLLMGMFKFTFVFVIPTILEYVGILKADWVRYVQYINPTKNALVLLLAPAVEVKPEDIWIALGYVIIVGGLLYIAARRNFDAYAMKESGV